jgi:hypothetical protein
MSSSVYIHDFQRETIAHQCHVLWMDISQSEQLQIVIDEIELDECDA